jgi:HAD superfamily hydrolase (TIGR01509 family)
MASKLRISATHELRGSKMLSNICAILLDLDGVVIDSEPAHERSLIEASDRLGRRITLSDTKQFKGSTELDCARILREMTNSAEDLSRIMQLRIDVFRTFFKEVTLVEGVLLFLRRCKAKKWPMALTTSAQREIQELAFKQFSLAGYFDFVVTGNDIIHGKPHPEPYVRTAEKVGYPPSRCLVVEDSTNGVRSAKAAGCQTVGITTSFSSDTLLTAGADIVVRGFPELGKILFEEVYD